LPGNFVDDWLKAASGRSPDPSSLCDVVPPAQTAQSQYQLLPTIVNHLAGSLHRAEGHRQRATGGVLKALTRSEDRLIPDYARTSCITNAMGKNHPMA